MSKRPLGIYSSQRAKGSLVEPVVTDIHIEHIETLEEPDSASSDAPSTKKRRLSLDQAPPLFALAESRPIERSKAAIEDWEDIKEVFATATEKYEAEEPEEAVELFRRVIHESDHLLRLYPEPIVFLSSGRNPLLSSWTSHVDEIYARTHNPLPPRDPIRTNDALTSFHYIYGTSMLLLGKILEAYPTLAKDVEPVNTPAFYLAALDVLEDGENAYHSVSGNRFPKEDWRLSVSVGRTLVCLAEEKLRRLSKSNQQANGFVINFQDDLWPKDSAFAPSFSKRPPLTRRVTLPSASPHEVLNSACDHFSRAMLHMPHHKRRHRNGLSNHMDSMDMGGASMMIQEVDAPPTMPGLGSRTRSLLHNIRPRVLYTIGSDVLSVAERLPVASERLYWAKWVDEVFLQMEMEELISEDWSHPIAVGRGRCWLIIGSTHFEVLETQLERDPCVLDTAEAEAARQALFKATQYLGKAQLTRASDLAALPDPFSTDVSPMLGEAYVTLATLTPEGPAKEEYFARAAAEGVDLTEDDESMMDANS